MKAIIKATCDSITMENGKGIVRFVIEIPAGPGKPGEAVERKASTIIQIAYSDAKEAAQFEYGKEAIITIEQ